MALFVALIELGFSLAWFALGVALYWHLHRIGKSVIAEATWWMMLVPTALIGCTMAAAHYAGQGDRTPALLLIGLFMAALLVIRARRPRATASLGENAAVSSSGGESSD